MQFYWDYTTQRLWLDYEYNVNEILRLQLYYDCFVNEMFDHDYDYDYKIFIIDCNKLWLRGYDYWMSDRNTQISSYTLRFIVGTPY